MYMCEYIFTDTSKHRKHRLHMDTVKEYVKSEGLNQAESSRVNEFMYMLRKRFIDYSVEYKDADDIPFEYSSNTMYLDLYLSYLCEKYNMNSFLSYESTQFFTKLCENSVYAAKQMEEYKEKGLIHKCGKQLYDCILKCHEDTNTEMFILPITIYSKTDKGEDITHQNILIYRKSLHQIDHLEPHGVYFGNKIEYSEVLLGRISKVVQKVNELVKKYKQIKPEHDLVYKDTHEHFEGDGPQSTMEYDLSVLGKKVKLPVVEGTCALWTILLSTILLEAKNLSTRQVMEILLTFTNRATVDDLNRLNVSQNKNKITKITTALVGKENRYLLYGFILWSTEKMNTYLEQLSYAADNLPSYYSHDDTIFDVLKKLKNDKIYKDEYYEKIIPNQNKPYYPILDESSCESYHSSLQDAKRGIDIELDDELSTASNNNITKNIITLTCISDFVESSLKTVRMNFVESSPKTERTKKRTLSPDSPENNTKKRKHAGSNKKSRRKSIRNKKVKV